MSIMSMFANAVGLGNQQQQQQQNNNGAGNPGNIPAGAGETATNNTTNTPETQQIQSPLDQFKDIWQPATTDSNTQATGILGNVDPSKVMEAASKTDFSKVVNQETMAKINAGGPEAMQAMMEAMQRMAQTVYGQAAIASAKMVEQAATKMEDKFKTNLPGEFKRLTVSEQLRNENPIFANPAIAPLVSAMETQFTQKFPNASAAEITKMAKDYIAGVGTAFSPAQTQSQEAANKAGEEDWSKFFNV